MDFPAALNWRYAAKNLNGQPVPAPKVDAILEAIRLAASSTGLQPFEVLVISDHELKGRIHEKACQQPQIVEGSHILVFAAQKTISAADVEAYMQRIAQVRQVPMESLTGFSDAIKGGLLTMSAEHFQQWSIRQAYIALGFGLVAAAVEEVDSCALEGFNPDALDELLGLPERNLRSAVMLVLGYRDEAKDFLAKAKKVRKTRPELFTEIA
ncbi:nitroreductase family protein [Hymenobacter metallicola]|uniref:NAD(P)H-dependent oxidoreductase n=1 Tax=Hymenobacter metallicola TaxID=2563114 RepID=A0A4Z0Q1Q1_9BACT|nr:nitroreductase family protein [Hymenobacter metallicola]TGE23419.1 NAD(P)H-dependent oxidoreductase [Hymenobacter metallicola]